MNTILSKLLLCIYFFTLCLSCTNNEKENQLNYALELAGNNKYNLKKVLEYYKQDTLKLEAAKFLIRNMPYHYFMDEYFISPNGDKYQPDIKLFSNIENLKRHCDSLVNCGYKIKRHKILDIKAIDDKYLITNIELAFTAWKKPWAKTVPFHDFCRYILPYRSQNEKNILIERKNHA